MEKKLKRLTWLVSVAAFVIFAFMTVNYVNEASSGKWLLDHAHKQLGEARKECFEVKLSNSFGPMPENGPCSFVAGFDERSKVAAGDWHASLRKESDFFKLMLSVPMAVWFLFFSLRWVLTGRKPWQRDGSTPT